MSAPETPPYTGRIYPGLRPFDVEDALLFFGREEQTDELLRRLDDTRFLAVVGLSGSGKSSLVRAGLLPALRRGHLSGAGSRWRLSVMRPGSDPLGALARVLNETIGHRDDRLAVLRSGKLGLLDTSRQGRNADDNLLLVVDQFEEIFRFQDSNLARSGEAPEFVELLLAASQEYEPTYRVYVVITLRSDYLGECARFRGLPEALNESQYLVPRMTQERLREAIDGPAKLGGVALTEELREELLDKTGDDPDQLPVMQHLLMRVWEIREPSSMGSSIGHNQYEIVGGWADALNIHAETVWNALGNRRDLAKRILQRLTEKTQAGREVRRPATVQELAEVAEVTAGEVIQVVEHFRSPGCNFLTSPDCELTEDSVIDISHESLIRRWKSLNEWATEEADWGEWYRRLEDRIGIKGAYLVDPELQSAIRAREEGRWNEAWAARYRFAKDGVERAYEEVIRFLEESSKRRRDELSRLRRTRVIIATTAVVFAALSILATYSWWTARKAHQQAEYKAREAVDNAREAKSKQQEAEQARVEAQHAKNALGEQYRKTQLALADARLKGQEAEQEREAERKIKVNLADALKRIETPRKVPIIGLNPSMQQGVQPVDTGVARDQLQHFVVLMMESRSFDHMLGSLKALNPDIDGITDQLSNPDVTGAPVKPQPQAAFQAQLQPDPNQHFPAVDLQIFGGDTSPTRVANMQGFVKSYFNRGSDVEHSHTIMYYFKKSDLPVLTTLALEFAICDRWFSSLPGPSIPNRAFAHYGTSFGRVDLSPIYSPGKIKSVYTRLLTANPPRTSKVYYYDTTTSTMEVANLLEHQPQLFGTYSQFLDDCKNGNLPDYSFIEPNYSDHQGDRGEEVANDQHPDHNVQQGEVFIAEVYNAIHENPDLWFHSVLLITYSNHGGIYDHVPPPAATPDGFVAPPDKTGTGKAFAFDRLGVRVPAVIVSPYIPRGYVDHTVYDHASIPATVTKFFGGSTQDRSPREQNANTFEHVLTLSVPRTDTPIFAP